MYRVQMMQSPVGVIAITEEDGAIVSVQIGSSDLHETTSSSLLEEMKRQFHLFFAGKLREFDVPTAIQRSPFVVEVLDVLRQSVCYGETASYSDLARMIGRPRASRAVAMALHHNPLHIIYPCHRIIAADGSLGGFAAGTAVKARLLEIEMTNRDR